MVHRGVELEASGTGLMVCGEADVGIKKFLSW